MAEGIIYIYCGRLNHSPFFCFDEEDKYFLLIPSSNLLAITGKFLLQMLEVIWFDIEMTCCTFVSRFSIFAVIDGKR